MKKLTCLAMFAALLGCTSLLNTDGYKLDTEETTDVTSQPCSSCTQKNCASEMAACSKNLSCKGRQRCFDQCELERTSTSSCDASCLENLSDWGLLPDVQFCQAQHCEMLCDRQCGGWAYRVDGCASCIQRKCCEQATACSNNIDCRHLFSCYLECTPGDWGCYLDCIEKSADPDFGTFSASFESCLYQKCAVQCGGYKAWNCVEETSDIDYRKRDASISLQFYSIPLNKATPEPIEDVEVKMCYWNDSECSPSTALAIATSNAYGIAKLDWETNGVVERDVRLEISKSGRMSASLTFSRPLSYGPHMNQYWILPTLEELDVLADKFGVDVDPERGHVQIYMLDCAMAPGEDLVVSVPGVEGATPYYVKDYSPDSAANRTNNLGWAGFFNLPAGVVNLEAALYGPENSPVLKKSLNIRPGEISFALIWPE